MPIPVPHPQIEQLQLFEKPPDRPRWRDFPEATRGEVTKLVTRMLHAHAVDAAADRHAGVRND